MSYVYWIIEFNTKIIKSNILLLKVFLIIEDLRKLYIEHKDVEFSNKFNNKSIYFTLLLI